MGLNNTPSADRLHIAFFGRRNAGKSSLVNAVTGQKLSIVSEVLGTTTDPVYKAMELLPIGPVMIIDTPGLDDEGELGALRIKKARQVLNKTDIAVLVIDAVLGESNFDKDIEAVIRDKKIPLVKVFNKCDLIENKKTQADILYASAEKNIGIDKVLEKIVLSVPKLEEKRIIGDLINKNDTVLLITPIDASAPKGRLILPQQQTIRDILDSGAIAIVSKETECEETVEKFGDKITLAITDSQVFPLADKYVPKSIPLTSFSILMARKKGLLSTAVKGVRAIDDLKDGDTVLIAEGCTHHKQCEDIGSVKIPRWIREYTKKEIIFKTVSGTEFPEDLSPFKLIIHCGGCMLNDREIAFRMKSAEDSGIPITNYGTVIAYLKGILKRSLQLFPEISKVLSE